jgi:hypothetical protein
MVEYVRCLVYHGTSSYYDYVDASEISMFISDDMTTRTIIHYNDFQNTGYKLHLRLQGTTYSIVKSYHMRALSEETFIRDIVRAHDEYRHIALYQYINNVPINIDPMSKISQAMFYCSNNIIDKES